MAPKKAMKRALEDEVFTSKPVMKQKTFPARRKSVKVKAELEVTEPPCKKAKKRSTMTQLDFGRRSFFEIIGDSGGEDALSAPELSPEKSTKKSKKAGKAKRSKLPEKTESQATLTQPAFKRRRPVRDSDDEEDEDEDFKSESEKLSTAKPKATQRKPRSKLPPKTDSQGTMTQFVRKSSDLGATILDSEDEGVLSDAESMALDGNLTIENDVAMQEAVKVQVPRAPSVEPPMEDATPQIHDGDESDHPIAYARVMLTEVLENQSSQNLTTARPPKTPKRVRILPVLSSRSPPDTHLSTQPTPSRHETSSEESPLQEKHTRLETFSMSQQAMEETKEPPHVAPDNVEEPVAVKQTGFEQSIKAVETEQKAAAKKSEMKTFIPETFEHRSPLKEKSANIRVTRSISDDAAKASSIKKAPATKAKRGGPTESQTRRRVSDFNARFALLEQENANMRRGRAREPAFPSTVVRSRSDIPVSKKMAVQNKETQYSLGSETQAAWMELPDQPVVKLADVAEEPENSPEVVEASQPMEDVVDTAVIEVIDDEPAGPDHELTEDEEEDPAEIEQVLAVEEVVVPSSQTKGVTKLEKDVPLGTPSALEAPLVLEESLPESPYPPASARSATSKRDTQELASDQLMRETQAWADRVPSSQEQMPAPAMTTRAPKSSQMTATQDYSHFRPSQATTVDESMTYSSLRARRQLPLGTIPLQPTQKNSAPLPLSSSSPIEDPGVETTIQVISSSPLQQAPDLSPVISSSSPRIGEPKTPRVLRNLRAPLRFEELVSDSLDMSIPGPPTWRYGDGFEVDVGEESDDGEL